ncbi:hypothetical protein [Comamonas sp.]|uniref:hypothetical protein n=1 Tax=Comamonas sp. TaxID=34028 RepID=UPI00289CFF4C|nr:hypothetical protein [Comamonas sp.]
MKNYSKFHYHISEWKTQVDAVLQSVNSRKYRQKHIRQGEVRDSINKKNIELLLEWINAHESSRFYRNLEIFKSANAKIINREKLYSSEMWVMSELSEISTIIDYSSDFNTNDFNSILTEALNGAQHIDEEKIDGNNVARNKIFELNVASKLKKFDFNVTLGNTKESGSIDIHTSYDNRDFFIECKRLQVIASLNGNVKKAISQLEKKNIKRENSIIALDFTKIFWQEHLNNGNIIPDGEINAREILENAQNLYGDILKEKYSKYFNDILLFLCHINIPFNNTLTGPRHIRHFFLIHNNDTKDINLQTFINQIKKT